MGVRISRPPPIFHPTQDGECPLAAVVKRRRGTYRRLAAGVLPLPTGPLPRERCGSEGQQRGRKWLRDSIWVGELQREGPRSKRHAAVTTLYAACDNKQMIAARGQDTRLGKLRGIGKIVRHVTEYQARSRTNERKEPLGRT